MAHEIAHKLVRIYFGVVNETFSISPQAAQVFSPDVFFLRSVHGQIAVDCQSYFQTKGNMDVYKRSFRAWVARNTEECICDAIASAIAGPAFSFALACMGQFFLPYVPPEQHAAHPPLVSRLFLCGQLWKLAGFTGVQKQLHAIEEHLTNCCPEEIRQRAQVWNSFLDSEIELFFGLFERAKEWSASYGCSWASAENVYNSACVATIQSVTSGNYPSWSTESATGLLNSLWFDLIATGHPDPMLGEWRFAFYSLANSEDK
ncbi:hypothetical protein HZB90_02785 [archaeon]|nr:hypothetical protein [archaeon]